MTVVCSSYFSYAVFDDWRYLRFLLPLLTPLLVAMAAIVLWALGCLPAIVHTPHELLPIPPADGCDCRHY